VAELQPNLYHFNDVRKYHVTPARKNIYNYVY